MLHVADHDFGEDDVDVAVDQARHQGFLAAVDHVRLCRLDRLRRDFFDLVVLDEQFVAAAHLADFRIQHVEILEVDERHVSRSLEAAVSSSVRLSRLIVNAPKAGVPASGLVDLMPMNFLPLRQGEAGASGIDKFRLPTTRVPGRSA